MRVYRPSWWQDDTLLARTLAPLGHLYSLGTRIRLQWGQPWKAPIPVLCIGNITAGGAGKTPVVLDMLKRLPGAHALTRGYGGVISGPASVHTAYHTAHHVGDEALLLARYASTWVAHDRVRGAKAAMRAGATCLVMDDGFQNPSLAKTLSFVVMNGHEGFGNKRLIPAGPLREHPEYAWRRADALVLFGEDRTGILKQMPNSLPVFRAELRACVEPNLWRGNRVVAFAGIGHPKKFFDTLSDLGTDLVATRAFPDHHSYTFHDCHALCNAASTHDAVLVTTEKDAARLDPDMRQRVHVLPVAVSWNDENRLQSFLKERLI